MLNEKSSIKFPPFPRVGKGPGIGAEGGHVPDPAGQFASPYVGMGNSPVIGVDQDGKFAGIPPWLVEYLLNHYCGIVNLNEVEITPSYPHSTNFNWWNDFQDSYNTSQGGGNTQWHNQTPNTPSGSGSGNGNSGSYNGPWSSEYYSGKNKESNENASYKVNIDDSQKALAAILRYSPFLGMTLNPFYMAEAIIWDLGPTVFGNEIDEGQGMILAGPDAGLTFGYFETATGAGTDAGGSIEVTRIDYFGDINDFGYQSIAGERYKGYFGGVLGEGLSAGVAFSGSFPQSGGFIFGTTFQFGLGVSTPLFYGGVNSGNILINPRP